MYRLEAADAGTVVHTEGSFEGGLHVLVAPGTGATRPAPARRAGCARSPSPLAVIASVVSPEPAIDLARLVRSVIESGVRAAAGAALYSTGQPAAEWLSSVVGGVCVILNYIWR